MYGHHASFMGIMHHVWASCIMYGHHASFMGIMHHSWASCIIHSSASCILSIAASSLPLFSIAKLPNFCHSKNELSFEKRIVIRKTNCHSIHSSRSSSIFTKGIFTSCCPILISHSIMLTVTEDWIEDQSMLIWQSIKINVHLSVY